MTKGTVEVILGTKHFTEANEAVREALSRTDMVVVREAFAQRYLGCGMNRGKTLKIYGIPGNDLACYLDGGLIEVFGNVQDQIGNTMDDGEIIIHGRCGDAAGYGMRGGKIFIRDDCGWRVGIHMKQYGEKSPTIVIGGSAGRFLAEYMAGGVILLLGEAGDHLGTGMHGGVVYLRHQLAPERIPQGLVQEPVDDDDRSVIEGLLQEYNAIYQKDGIFAEASADEFYRLKSYSSRPYEAMYAN